MENTFSDSQHANLGVDIKPETGVVEERNSLTLDLPDEIFTRTVKKLIKDSEDFYNKKLNLRERRERNEEYVFGRQLRARKLKEYESRYQDNIIYEALAYLKPIALSQMPDIVVSPGNESHEAKKTADKISKVIESEIKKEKRRKTLAISFKHLEVFFLGAIKAYWDPDKGDMGDYDFRFVHPENLVLDHTASQLDQSDMGFIAEYVPWTVKECLRRFPSKKDDLIAKLHQSGKFDAGGKNENNEGGLNTVIKVAEVWFTWYDKVGGEYQKFEGTAWLYDNVLLGKKKNAYWDWEGQQNTVGLTEEVLRQSIMNGVSLPIEKVFHNYFDSPRKPYILLGYNQWGKHPLDETSDVEQSIALQEEHDKRGRQISQMLDRARPKNIFSTDSGLKKEDIEELDMADPDSDLLVDGDVHTVHDKILGEQPSPQAFNDLQMSQNRLFAKMGVNGTVRGQPESSVATTNQIARESDFTRADDLSEETINSASREMAEWILQFIKLFYTKDHFKKLAGPDGEFVFQRLNRDMIDDGMEVVITASGTDKIKAQQRAMDMAKLELIDPYTFYKDLGVSDPQGRVERLLMFKSDPQGYFLKYAKNMDTNQAAQVLNNGTQAATEALPAGEPPTQPSTASVGPTTSNPSPANTAQVNITPPTPPAPNPQV